MSIKKKYSQELILGLFVLIGLIIFILGLFLIGKENHLFERKVLLNTTFNNVAGLVIGADVLLSGVKVGKVANIKFPSIEKAKKHTNDVMVVLDISKKSMKWIREDSLASIDSKGLLGDKIINISIGSVQSPQLQDNSFIKSSQTVDFNKALLKAQNILNDVSEAVSDAKNIFKSFSQKGGEDSLIASAQSLQSILKEIKTGKGVISQLIYNDKAGNNMSESLQSVNSFMKQIKEGDGLINSLIYDKNGQDVVKHASNTLSELAVLFKEVKTGNGILHDLIYAKENGQFIKNLNDASANLKMMTEEVINGNGSLGLLMRDPSIYNELYGLLGDLNRNKILKSVVRFTISK